MDTAKLLEICNAEWVPFKRKYKHLEEDAISAATLAAFEAFLGKGEKNAATLERIARNAIIDFLEANAE